jgi:DNA modification methylase/transcriptional regulator with XRE-family HTH domain
MATRYIYHFRKVQKLTQQELATQANVSLNVIKRLEKRQGTLSSLNAVMDALNLEFSSSSSTDIKELIQVSNKSYRKLSQETGLSRITIKNIEAGKGTIESLFKLYKHFGVKVQLTAKRKLIDLHKARIERSNRNIRIIPAKVSNTLPIELNQIYHGDCLEVMQHVEKASVDLVCADIPFSCTQNHWDSIINLDKLWEQYRRVIKDNGVILLFAQSPFDKTLAMSAFDLYRYDIIQIRDKSGGYLNASRRPLQGHNNILVFYKKQPTYNPQKSVGEAYKNSSAIHTGTSYNLADNVERINTGERMPTTVIGPFKWEGEVYHPTQKNLACLDWLIKTFSNEGDTILDNTCGSGSTLVSAQSLGRRFVGIEKELEYCEVALSRLQTES